MKAQEILKKNYHEYLRIAAELPAQMRESGVFDVLIPIDIYDRTLRFSHEGTVQVDGSTPLAITSVDSILYACFPIRDGGSGYIIKPQNLDQVVPEHMERLRMAIGNVQKSLEDFLFYKK